MPCRIGTCDRAASGRFSRSRKELAMKSAHAMFECLETRNLMAAIVMNGTPGPDLFTIDQVNVGDTLTINGNGGTDTVKFGIAAGTMQNILGDVTINNPLGTT